MSLGPRRLSYTAMAGSTGHRGPWHLFAWPAAWSALQFQLPL